MSNLTLEIFSDKIADDSRRLIHNAYNDAVAWGHDQLTSEHILISIAKLESLLFNNLMRSLTLDPQVVIQELETKFIQGNHSGRAIKMSESLRVILSNALRLAHEDGRRQLESIDLFAALFKDADGYLVRLLVRLGVEKEFLRQKVADLNRKQ